MAIEQQIFGYFGTALKCVSLCVVMVQQVADLVRVFFAILVLL
jgi:hypothetical protein